MKSPVDIKAVFDAMGAAEEARSLPIRVHVYLDDNASSDIANIAMAATRTSAQNATVLYDTYPPQHAVPDASADLALLVSSGDARTGKLYTDLHGFGVPVIVFAANREAVCANSKAAGYIVSPEDIVAPSSQSSPLTLSDRTTGAPIELDTNDAQEMLKQFGEWIINTFKDKQLAFASAFTCVRRPLALEKVRETAALNAGIGVVVIIPGADMPLMTLNQVKMLLDIAAAYGEELSLGRIKEILAIVGGAFACRGLARQVLGVVPGVGWAVKGGIGYAGTIAMGHALLEYFESGADVAASARSIADAVKNAPAWAGASPDKSPIENAALIADAAREKVVTATGNAVRNLAPTVASVVSAAGEATGFTQDDLADMAKKALGVVREKVRK